MKTAAGVELFAYPAVYCDPMTAKVMHHLAIVRSMYTDQFNHAPAQIFMNTGSQVFGRPSIGSWLTYGLGSENQNLPGFVAMCPGGYPIVTTQNWRSAFLPGVYQGTHIDTQHTELEKLIENIRSPHAASDQRAAHLPDRAPRGARPLRTARRRDRR